MLIGLETVKVFTMEAEEKERKKTVTSATYPK